MEIREGTRKHHLRIIGQRMHIDRAYQVPMPGELALPAHPISACGLVSMPTGRTPTRCSWFRAGEAHDVSSLAFMGQVVDIFPIFPQGHALMVMAPVVLLTNAMRIANQERANLLFHTKVDDCASRFVSRSTNTPLGPTTLLKKDDPCPLAGPHVPAHARQPEQAI